MKSLKKYSFEYFISILVFSFLTLNYAGFCFSEMRFLSDQEKIKIAVQYIFERYPKVGDEAWYSPLGSNSKIMKIKSWPENPVPYKNLNEFFAINPNCCKVTQDYRSIGGEGDNTSAWGCISGKKSAIVGVRYLLRYRDENGDIQSKLKEIFPGISNCGELNWNIFEI